MMHSVLALLFFVTGFGSVKVRVIHKESKEPLRGAAVRVIGLPLGAHSRPDGRAYIYRLRADTAYDLSVQFVGYTPDTIKNVRIYKDSTVEVTLEVSPRTDTEYVKLPVKLHESETMIGAKPSIQDLDH
jgi:hypothetical protein